MKIEDIKTFTDYCLFIKEVGYLNLTKDDVLKLSTRLNAIGIRNKTIIKNSSLSKGYKRIEMKKIDDTVASLIITLLNKTRGQDKHK